MKPWRLLLCGILFVPLGCETSKPEQLVDILEEVIDVMQEAFDDTINNIEDNYDICNQCVRQVQAIVNNARNEMTALRNKYMEIRQQVKDHEHFAAIKAVDKKLDKTFRYMHEKQGQKAIYNKFKEFNSNCSKQMPEIMNLLSQIPRLYGQVMGMEFA